MNPIRGLVSSFIHVLLVEGVYCLFNLGLLLGKIFASTEYRIKTDEQVFYLWCELRLGTKLLLNQTLHTN